MATKAETAAAPAAATVESVSLLHPSLFEGRDVTPVTKGELRTILEFFAAGISGTAKTAAE